MAKKFTSNEVANICNKLPGLLHKHAGNGTKAAADLGLESFNVLRGLMSNYPSIQDAYNRGFDLITQEVLEAHLGAAMDRRRGMNTQASGRYLQAAMPDRFNPTQRVETVTGYAKPAAGDDGAREDDKPTGRPAFTLVNRARAREVNGGAPGHADGTREE